MAKIIVLVFFMFMSLTTIALADQCLPPSNITITKAPNTNGFIVNVPVGSGYEFIGENSPISETGPISFISIEIQSLIQPHAPEGPYNNIFATNNILCFYGINSTVPGTYPGGIFFLSKTGSFNQSYDLSGHWTFNLRDEFDCLYNLSGCQFAIHV